VNRPLFLVLATLILAACKENLSPPPVTGLGKDTVGPAVVLSPSHDTTVDSVGILLIAVNASDQSGIKLVDFLLVPPSFGFPTQAPLDTVYASFYPVQLGNFKHSSFRFYVRSTDVLDHVTITDTVLVTVR
jgi:hypothetical protein